MWQHHQQHHDASGIDWGTAPAWAAVAVAVVVGAFSVVGILLARRTYQHNAWQTKVRVARLVYCDVRRRAALDKGANAANVKFYSKAQSFGMEHISDPKDGPDGDQYFEALEDVAFFSVDVTNNSDEPVGKAEFAVLNSDDATRVQTRHPMIIGTLAPGESKKFSLVVPRSWTRSPATSGQVLLHFIDSAGVAWDRIETDPPVAVGGLITKRT